ncbi:rhomboid-like protein [Streptomyces sp. NPDC004284]|uniref:rhomboid-like protein n=1 Tax=Streptomyces sp. NPDC004284 TaxID=3364695 RepID=UPI003675F90C
MLVSLAACAAFVQLSVLDAEQRDWLEGYFSTSLVNLGDHPLQALVGSAFVPGDRPWPEMAAVAFAVTAAADRFGGPGTMSIIAMGHIGGTVVSEGVLGLRILGGQEPVSLIRLEDVGSSYLLVSALTAVVAWGVRTPVRVLAACVLLAAMPRLLDGLTAWGVPAMGHVVAMVSGVLLGRVPRCPGRATTVSTPLSTVPDRPKST